MFDRPHDALVKAIFGNLSHAAGLLRTGLPGDLAIALDFDTLEQRSGSFLDHPREITADLVGAEGGTDPRRGRRDDARLGGDRS